MKKEIGDNFTKSVEGEKSAEKVSEAVFFRFGDSNEYRFQMKGDMPLEFYEKMEEKLEQLLGEGNYTIQSRGTRIEIGAGFSGILSGHKDEPFDRDEVIKSLEAVLEELAPGCHLKVRENTF